MKTELEKLRTDLRELYAKRDRGDLTERVFQQQLAERTVDLYRSIISQRMVEGESIEREHHAISTHFRLVQSILGEPAQQATSLFLTNRRLYRLRSTIMPDRSPTGDSGDETHVDEIPLDQIRFLKKKFQIRVGEILVGAGFCAVALLFYDWLAITGPLLLGLGALGMLHALILPTRWIEVGAADTSPSTDPILIYAVREKSARRFVRSLQEELPHS